MFPWLVSGFKYIIGRLFLKYNSSLESTEHALYTAKNRKTNASFDAKI
jgi:hypothetical protein